MSVAHTSENGIVRFNYVGKHNPAAETAAILQVVESDRFEPGTNLLLDVSMAEVVGTQDEIMDFARFLGDLRGRVGPRCAVVVSSQVQYGVARMLAAHVELNDLTVSIFIDPVQAQRWLRLNGGDRADPARSRSSPPGPPVDG